MSFRQNFSQKKKNLSPFQKKTLAESVNFIPKGLRKGNPFHGPFAQLSHTRTRGHTPQDLVVRCFGIFACRITFQWTHVNSCCFSVGHSPQKNCSSTFQYWKLNKQSYKIHHFPNWISVNLSLFWLAGWLTKRGGKNWSSSGLFCDSWGSIGWTNEHVIGHNHWLKKISSRQFRWILHSEMMDPMALWYSYPTWMADV